MIIFNFYACKKKEKQSTDHSDIFFKQPHSTPHHHYGPFTRTLDGQTFLMTLSLLIKLVNRVTVLFLKVNDINLCELAQDNLNVVKKIFQLKKTRTVQINVTFREICCLS